MKNQILLISAMLITAGAYAQTDSTNRKIFPPEINKTEDDKNQHNDRNRRSETDANDQAYVDGVRMEKGKLVMIKNGLVTSLDKDMTISNGTRGMRDGTYFKKDGSKLMLKEGQYINMSGKMFPMNKSGDP